MRKTVKKKLVLKKSVRNFVSRVLILIIVFLSSMILVKQNSEFKNFIIDNVYNKNIKFTKFRKLYEKYFGDILSVDKITKIEQPVFSEKLKYNKANIYKDGVSLSVSKNMMIPVLEGGVVVYIGKKEDYGDVVIVEQVNGVDVMYGNIKLSDISLYDYVEKGQLLGEVINDKLYLVFQKDGKYVDYKEFI